MPSGSNIPVPLMATSSKERSASARISHDGYPLLSVAEAIYAQIGPKAIECFQALGKSLLQVTFASPAAFLKAVAVGTLAVEDKLLPLTAVESPVLTVFLKDLPRWISKEAIASALLRYGDLLDHQFETFKDGILAGVKNGNRRLRFRAKKMIPNIVTIMGHRTLITFPGVERQCFQCRSVTHTVKHCPKKRKSSQRPEAKASDRPEDIPVAPVIPVEVDACAPSSSLPVQTAVPLPISMPQVAPNLSDDSSDHDSFEDVDELSSAVLLPPSDGQSGSLIDRSSSPTFAAAVKTSLPGLSGIWATPPNPKKRPAGSGKNPLTKLVKKNTTSS